MGNGEKFALKIQGELINSSNSIGATMDEDDNWENSAQCKMNFAEC